MNATAHELTEADLNLIMKMDAIDPMCGKIARIWVRLSDEEKKIAKAEMIRIAKEAGEAEAAKAA